MRRTLGFLAVIVLSYSCNSITIDQKAIQSNVLNKPKGSLLDTIVYISSIPSKYNNVNLTKESAKKILYKYFENKGYLTEINLPVVLSEKDHGNLCVYYDSLYFVDLNKDKYLDAIIEYRLTPPAASGHCYQLQRAMIIDHDKGYKLENENFLHDNFVIDSIKSMNEHLIIYGYDYDCSSNQILRNFRATIVNK